MGSGHLSRQLALAQVWVDTGGQAVLASDHVPPEWVRRFSADGVAVVGTDASNSGADWVVLDGYGLGSEQATARARAAHVAVVDDHGTIGHYDAEVIVDQNLGATGDLYGRRPPSSDLLLGTRYALLRRPFRQAAPIAVRSTAHRILVGLGGSPPAKAEMLVENALSDGRLADLERVTLQGVDDPVPVMGSVDLALVAAGTTTWEVCRLGIPAVLLVLADNQAPVAAAMQSAGAAIDVGWFDRLDPSALAAVVADARHQPVRRRLGAEAATLVDGRGAIRVVSRLRSALLAVRSARDDDARMLWEWANEPGVRRAAFSEAPIAWDDHVRWFEKKRADPSCRHYVIEGDGRPVAQVRFDAADGEAEIDVSVAVEQRGRGLGPAVILAAARTYFDDTAPDRVVARVRPENTASAVAFGDAAFEYEGERSARGATWLQYARVRNDRPA